MYGNNARPLTGDGYDDPNYHYADDENQGMNVPMMQGNDYFYDKQRQGDDNYGGDASAYDPMMAYQSPPPPPMNNFQQQPISMPFQQAPKNTPFEKKQHKVSCCKVGCFAGLAACFAGLLAKQFTGQK